MRCRDKGVAKRCVVLHTSHYDPRKYSATKLRSVHWSLRTKLFMEKALALVVLVTKRDNNESLRLLWKRPLKVFQRCLWEWGAAMDLGAMWRRCKKDCVVIYRMWCGHYIWSGRPGKHVIWAYASTSRSSQKRFNQIAKHVTVNFYQITATQFWLLTPQIHGRACIWRT